MSGILGTVGRLASGTFGGTAGAALTSIGSQALSASGLLPAFIRQGRKIGTIIPDVTIEEHFTDRLQVTQHPVAKGTPVSDHAFVLPKTITMRCGWTNANLVGGIVEGISGLISGGSIGDALSSATSTFTEERASNIYKKLVDLQTKREPFTLTTGKRTYEKNMVITELSVTNDHRTEYALIISVQMQEVILVDVGEAEESSNQENQTKPETTQPTSDGGNKQAETKPQSQILPSLFGFGVHDYNPVK